MDNVTTELFADFEINSDPRWPLLMKLAAGSLALHALFLASVLFVPGVRDSFNIAFLFSGTESVDEAYTKTHIGERATVIDLAQEKFQYPEGYFSQAVQEPAPDPFAAQVIEEARATPAPQLPKIVKPTPTPTPEPTPTPAATPSPAPSVPAKTTEAAAQPTPEKSKEELERELDKAAAENKVARPDGKTFNNRPLKDWLAKANELKVKGELDLSSDIELVIESELEPSGKLRNAEVVQKTGDPRVVAVATELVAALSDSNGLSFLKDPDFPEEVKKLRIIVRMNQTEVAAKVESEAPTAERAKQMANGYNLLLFLARQKDKGRDEEVLYKSTKVSSSGKQVVVDFSMPRQTAETMIKKKLPAS